MIGAFYVICAWGLQIGWGTDNLGALANSPTAPAFVLADRLWHGGSIIVLIALVNSGIGVCIACTTSSTRTLFGMARTGALPEPLARVSEPTGRPSLPCSCRALVAVDHRLAVGCPLGPYNLFNLLGTTGTFVYIPIFILMNIACLRYFLSRQRAEFRVLQLRRLPHRVDRRADRDRVEEHRSVPRLAGASAPVLAAGYLLLGVAVLVGRNLRPGKRAWMTAAGELPDVN